MLRSGRSKLHSKWSTAETDDNQLSNKDLESANLLQNLQRSSRSNSKLHYPCSSVVKIVLCISTCFLMGFPLFRPNANVESDTHRRWSAYLSQEELHATRHASSNTTPLPLIPLGKSLQISSLSNPPRIDRIKLLARLAKVEAHFPEDDLNEDIDAIANNIHGSVYGLSHWPPLISRIPTFSGHRHEEYSSEIADSLFCSATPCKILLPVWTPPLSPAEQLIQIQTFVQLARRLKRTLVLPNVGPVNSDGDEMLLGLGTCLRYPFARYFDASKLLFTPVGKDDDRASKLAAPMQPFSEWVKYRPVHPSAQVVVIDSAPSNDIINTSFTVGEAEIRIDEQAQRGRGRHKTCLSSRATKLNFGNRTTIVISPKRPSISGATTDFGLEGALGNKDEQVMVNSTYVEDIVAYLGSEAMKSDDALCNATTGSASCVMPNLALDIGNPDVLVIEWGVGPPLSSFAIPGATAKDKDLRIDFSPRLYALSRHILSTVQSPLVVLRPKPDILSNFSDTSFFFLAKQIKLSGLVTQLHDVLQNIHLNPGSQEKISSENSSTADREANVGISMDNSFMNETESREKRTPIKNLGTIWLGRPLTRDDLESSLKSEAQVADREPEETHKPHDLDSSQSSIEPLYDVPFDDTYSNLSVIDVSSATSVLKSRNSRFAGLTKHDFLGDELARIILADIIEMHADRVFTVGRDGKVSQTSSSPVSSDL